MCHVVHYLFVFVIDYLEYHPYFDLLFCSETHFISQTLKSFLCLTQISAHLIQLSSVANWKIFVLEQNDAHYYSQGCSALCCHPVWLSVSVCVYEREWESNPNPITQMSVSCVSQNAVCTLRISRTYFPIAYVPEGLRLLYNKLRISISLHVCHRNIPIISVFWLYNKAQIFLIKR